MEVSIATFVKHVTKLIQHAEQGEDVLLLRRGKPVARITAVELPAKKRKLGTLQGKAKLNAGWDKPLDLSLFDVFSEKE